MNDLSFRPLTRADLPRLTAWLAEPHVERWWHGAVPLAAVAAKYTPRIDGEEPTTVSVIELAGQPIGWIQWFRWADYPAHAKQVGAPAKAAGVDLAIGDLAWIGKGLGAVILRRYINDYVFCHADLTACYADPESANTASLRAFAKAGFTPVSVVRLAGEDADRRIVRLAK